MHFFDKTQLFFIRIIFIKLLRLTTCFRFGSPGNRAWITKLFIKCITLILLCFGKADRQSDIFTIFIEEL